MLPDRKRQNTRGKNYVVLARIGCPTRRQAANNKQVGWEGDAKGRGLVALPYGRGSLTLRSLCGLRADKWTVIQAANWSHWLSRHVGKGEGEDLVVGSAAPESLVA